MTRGSNISAPLGQRIKCRPIITPTLNPCAAGWFDSNIGITNAMSSFKCQKYVYLINWAFTTDTFITLEGHFIWNIPQTWAYGPMLL